MKILANLLNDLFSGLGFKKKGNYWVHNGQEISRMIHLQKSQYGNSFYINYGFIVTLIPLDGLMMHVHKRLGSEDPIEFCIQGT